MVKKNKIVLWRIDYKDGEFKLVKRNIKRAEPDLIIIRDYIESIIKRPNIVKTECEDGIKVIYI